MAKRVALFLLGLAVVLAAFFLYQYVSGPDTAGKRATLAPTSGPATLPREWEQRDENGVLQYVISAASAPTAIRDPSGKPLPNQYEMEGPLATFYDRTGRVIQVRADACRVIIPQAPRQIAGPAGGMGISGTAKGAQSFNIREGELTGHVRLTIGPRPDTGATSRPAGRDADLLASGMRIYVDDSLHLDGIQEILSSAGAIHIRGDRVGFDGQGMQLVFNRKDQRIEYLGIEKGNQIIIRGVGQKALDLGGPAVNAGQTAAPGRIVAVGTQPATLPAMAAASQPATSTLTAAAPAATQPPKVPPTTYRLSFGQDVRASVAQSVLTSDHLYVIFMGGRGLGDLGPDNPAAPTPGGAASTPTPAIGPGGIPLGAAPLANVPDVPEPIAPPTADDLVVHWTGPMEVRPADAGDLKLVDGKDVALEAVGTATKPVNLTDARFHVQAGRLWYHGAEQRIMLEPEDFGKVILEDPTRGNVQCLAVSVDQLKKKAILNGPGTLLAKSGGNATQISWKTHMDLDLVSASDAADSRKSTFAVRHAVIYGAGVKSDVLDFSADTLDVLVANVVEKGRQVQAMEHLLATGNVLANSFKHSPVAGAAPIPQGGIQAQRLEITTKTVPGSNLPVASQMLALGGDGPVEAWRWSARGKGLTISDPAQGLQKETISTAHLVALLAPKPKAETAPATATRTAADSGFASMGQNFDVTRFIASDGAKVVIAPPPASKAATIVATAQTLDAYPDQGTAVLASAAGGAPVRVAIGDNALTGAKILLDQNAKTFQVPGPGTFNLTLPADAKTHKAAAPMVVTWQDSMNYDDNTHLATFAGKPIARMLPEPGAIDQSDQARMTCDKTLLVQLKATASATQPAAAPALLGSTSLALDWIQAVGKVEAYGAQVGPDGKLLTRLRLSAIDVSDAAPAKLRYSDGEHAFVVNGPGAMVVEDFRPEKAAEQVSAAGESDFLWSGGLRYDQSAGTITFSSATTRPEDAVKFFFFPNKPFKFSGGLAGAATTPAAGTRPPDYVHLETHQLVATFAKPKDSAGKTIDSPIGLGAAGNQNLAHVDATGGTQFFVGTYQVAPAGTAQAGQKIRSPNYRVAGDSMIFDVPTNVATVNGTADEPAVIDQLGTTNHGSGQSIIVDLTKDKFSARIVKPTGNISGFGQ